MSRCYFDGIPDDAPQALVDAGLVPSWKAIAQCILKNDLHLRGLGFDSDEPELCATLRRIKAEQDSPQRRLI